MSSSTTPKRTPQALSASAQHAERHEEAQAEIAQWTAKAGDLTTEVARLRALVRRMEWVGPNGTCLICRVPIGEPHSPECDFANV